MQEELFIYLGKNQGVYFYSHMQQNKKSDYVGQSGQIYNVMIHENMIGSNESVIVFNFLNDTRIMSEITDDKCTIKNNLCEVVSIQHELFQFVRYTDKDLAIIYENLLEITCQKSIKMIISYNGAFYNLYEKNTKMNFIKSADEGIIINNIHYVICKKFIDYL